MKKLVLVCLAVFGVLVGCKSANTEPSEVTNFIVIFTDDLGYGDVGVYGAEGYETPYLDAMANDGMRFTDFSVSSSICTPSRAGLLTGRYAQRWNHDNGVFWPHSKDGMPASEITIAEMLKEKGYKTGMVGKWHLGHQPEFLPTAQGFNMYYGIPYSNDMWRDPEMPLAEDVVFNEGFTVKDYKSSIQKNKLKSKVPLMLGNKVVKWPVDQSVLTRKYTDKAKQFILENKEEPFFLYMAHSMPHIPLYASKDFAGKTKRGLFGDVIQEIDWSVGEILKTLKAQGLDKNTMVIFTSDNGPWVKKRPNAGSAGVFRDGKFSSYEGGSRVPCIVWQPGTVPSGAVSNEQTSTLDILPTIANIAGASVPKDRTIDGLNITEVFKGNTYTKLDRPYFLYRGDGIRIGDWKYVKDKDSEQLFNLSTDKEESKNLMEQYPDKAQELIDSLESVRLKLN
ncbi:sulfatase [Algibacter amylolyticus]|uniref:Sulfatase n=1 Tax=Algibacter amylolyticus TaxID=1608400 RepID=A0A5M7BDJ8_9FLAO|nr:sulfatase [Algibacter amylolyticus]KAA5825205.1 sulfatase [Algibacter amylolyticus]MBB5268673.1 arylsulfatase A-like enzyme [Algibacter amylolyticus]TSJ77699.1 sulfatase [Algibacter amylolyticus]